MRREREHRPRDLERMDDATLDRARQENEWIRRVLRDRLANTYCGADSRTRGIVERTACDLMRVAEELEVEAHRRRLAAAERERIESAARDCA